MPLAFLLSSN